MIKSCCVYIEAETLRGVEREKGEKDREDREDKEETVITSIDCCPVVAKWRCCCMAEGTIFATHPDCSTVISVSEINTHECPKKEIGKRKKEMIRAGEMSGWIYIVFVCYLC